MNKWIKGLIVILIIFGFIWCLVGICAAYDQLNKPATRYGGGPKPLVALLMLAASITAAAICWSVAAAAYLLNRFQATMYLCLTEIKQRKISE